MSADSEKIKEKIIPPPPPPKPSSRDGNMLNYLVRAQPSSTEAATLSSPDSDDNQTQDRDEPEYQSHSQAHEALIQPFTFCYEPGVMIKKWKWNQQQALKLFTVFVDNKK